MLCCVPQPIPNLKVEEGSPVTLATKVSGIPAPRVAWFKDGVELVRSPDYVLKHLGQDASLTIPKASQRNAGKFSLVAENVVGKAVMDVFVTVVIRGE